ncbi:G-protein coupled receptor 4-like [Carassius auratus]|uniref:G-protein coupled receptor 4-like n=1 Tax=Carassius auratus TaxID=7957 RepID=A0A6P6ME04_CARAU|nr:G-protein coupled receptor 4-like [Carassius auratus]XP_052443611.1 G-protein coupled receptor 4-like [Carassius gibelio]
MNNSTVTFNTLAASANATTQSIGPIESLQLFLCSFTFLFGMPIHSYVIWLIITGAGSGVALEFFNLNMAVCEIGICIFCFVDSMAIWFSYLKIGSNFFLGLGITGRSLFLCLMCLERYLAVVHPVTFLKYKPLRYRVICSTVVCILTLGSCLFSMFILMALNNTAHTWFFTVQIFLFFSIQLFCLVAVLRALKQSGPGDRAREREEENNMKRKAFHLILITSMNMVFINVPFIILALFRVVTKQNSVELRIAALICYSLGGFVQPVLYLHRIGKLSCLCSS